MKEDKIGREEIVNKVCGLVDSLQKDQNLCLSINGAWGSGKSFVLNMIEEQLLKKQEYVLVKYDAWSNSFYSDPLIAILSCILDGIDGKLYLVEQYEIKLKNATKTSANTLAKLSSKIAKLKDVISGIKEVIQNFHNPIDLKPINDFKTYQALLRETKGVLNEITQKGEYREKQTKLIVLVDEIDRCLPNEQLKILERLHHLFDVKNCAVLVAMNQVCIAQTVNKIYGIDGNEYLRKYFDFTFELETSASEYLKNLLMDFEHSLDKIGKLSPEVSSSIKLAYQCLLYGKQKVLDKVDNRELSRYYSCLFDICNSFSWEKLTARYVFFIIVGLYIRKIISSTFLSEDEIIKNQKQAQSQLPYYDYLLRYLGIDRTNLFEKLSITSLTYRGNVPEFSWDFNEIVHFSISKQQDNLNGLRRMQMLPPVIVADCNELRRLIILYGGERANATDER